MKNLNCPHLLMPGPPLHGVGRVGNAGRGWRGAGPAQVGLGTTCFTTDQNLNPN